VFLPIPHSITSRRAGLDAADDRRAIITTCPNLTIRSMRRPYHLRFDEGVGMVSTTTQTRSGPRELRLSQRKACLSVQTPHAWCALYFRKIRCNDCQQQPVSGYHFPSRSRHI